MSIDKIKVDTTILAADADSIAENIRYIESCINSLEEEYAVLDSMWEGPANEIYSMVFKKDIEILRAHIVSLKNINVYENIAKEHYNNCENEVNSHISSVVV